MTYIDESTKEKIISSASIVNIISGYVNLTKKGDSYKGLCPFHDEKTPSFSVSEKKRIFKCFGCGKTGSVVDFIMEREQKSFPEALQFLADKSNIAVVPGKSTKEPAPKYESRPAKAKEKDGEYLFDIKEKIEEHELKILGRFVTAEVCKKYNLYSLHSFTYISNRKAHIDYSTEDYPIFLWYHSEDFQKLYFPRENRDDDRYIKRSKDDEIPKRSRFRWCGNKPHEFIFGLQQLNEEIEKIKKENAKESEITLGTQEGEKKQTPVKAAKVKELFMCSGESDALNVASLGYNVICLNSETSYFSFDKFREIEQLTEKFFYIPDIDETGMRVGRERALRFLKMKVVWLPESLADKKDWKRKSCKDVREYLRHYTPADFRKLKDDAVALLFWVKAKKKFGPQYEINDISLYEFLAANGFYVFKKHTDDSCYLHIDNNIIEKISPKYWGKIRDYVIKYIRKFHFEDELLNHMYRTERLGEGSLSNLPEYEPVINNYGPDHQYFFYKNCAVLVTPGKIEEIHYSDLKVNCWKDKIIDRNFKVTQPFFEFEVKAGNIDGYLSNSDFSYFRFVWNTCRIHWEEENNRQLTEEEMNEQYMHFLNRVYCLGYILHRYKDPSRAWAVITMDATETPLGTSYGGSGKSFLFNSLKHLIKRNYIDGRIKSRLDSQFLLGNVSKDDNYIMIDDAHQYMDFHNFLNSITESMVTEAKAINTKELDFSDSPKIIITTNHALRKLDASAMRRALFTAFSDYYHFKDNNREEMTPRKEFGKNLITDYTPEEMNLFDNFLMQCLSFYLKCSDKIDPPMREIESRNLRQSMGEAFLDWAAEYFSDESRFNSFIPRNEMYEHYKIVTGIKENKSHLFKKQLDDWCNYNGHILNPESYVNTMPLKNRKIVQRIGNSTQEMFYVKKGGRG
jgi:hypothetical protein